MWTKFFDLASGGSEKTKWESIFIELPKDEAVEYFEKEFGRNPYNVTCSCCGSDFSVYEVDEPEISDRNRIINAAEIYCV